MLAVILLVALRLTIGWHFFYEGVWKVANADEFSALPFLNMAKGPFAPIFYSMTPDLEGRIRMQVKDGKVACDAYRTPWAAQKALVEKKYALSEEQKENIDAIYDQYVSSLDTFLTSKAGDVQAYFVSLDLLKKDKSNGNDGPEQKKRQWEQMMKLRGEMNGWLKAIEGLGADMTTDFESVLTTEQKSKSGTLPEIIPTTDRMPLGITFPFASWTSFLNFTITWALTAIGFCLITGFCARLAAIGGGLFLCSVCMTQPAWPLIWPHDAPILGHAMIVDKNFVEMVAIFTLATMPVGRWAGLDYFVWNWFGKPVLKLFGFTQWTEEA